MIESAEMPKLMGVTIRPATVKDAAAIVRIRGNARRRYMPPYFPGGVRLNDIWIEDNKVNGPQEVREQIRNANEDPARNLFSVATITDARYKERVAGFLRGKIRHESPNGIFYACEILDFAVRKDYTYRGIGGLLETDMYMWARDVIGAQIDVEIPSTNRRAKEFFYNRGYEPLANISHWPNNETFSDAAPTVLWYLHPEKARRNYQRYPHPPPRPEWHVPRSAWDRSAKGTFHPTDYWGKHGSDDLQRNYMVNRADQLRREAEKGTRPHVRRVEAACYDLLTKTDDQLRGTNFEPIIREGQLVGIRDATLQEDDFVEKLLTLRAAALKSVHAIAQELADYGVIGQASGAISLPLVIINADNIGILQNFGISAQDAEAAFAEAPNWKASEHMVYLSKNNEAHDFRSYALKTSEELGMTLDDFLFKQQMHEALHPIIDFFTDHWYGEVSTWLNEAFCDTLANFNQRANYHLGKIDNHESVTIEDVMETENNDALKGGGYVLLQSIGLALNPVDMLDGISIFMRKLFGKNVHDRHPAIKLNKDVMSQLKEMGILPIVEQLFQGDIIEKAPFERYQEAIKELYVTANNNERRDDYGLYPIFAKLWDTLNGFSMDADAKEKMLVSMRERLEKHPNAETRLQAYIVYNLISWYHEIETGEAKLVRYEEGPDGSKRPVYEGRYGHQFRADYDPVPVSPLVPDLIIN